MTPPRSGDATPLVVALGLVVLLLAVVDAAVAYVPSTWIQRDGRFYTNTNVTLVERGSVDQSEWAASWYERDLGWNRTLDAAWSNVAQGRHGNRVPKHPILMPVLSTPLYWAFGLRGLLLFNLLAFAGAGAAAFAFARRYASPTAALIAAGAFLLATGVRTHVYDYHVDVLLLALWLGGLAALHARRGLAAGVLVAGALMLKPTTILLVPAAALLGRPDRKTFGWAIAGGAGALALWAMKNWVVFGQPWWAGYNRMLVVEDGRIGSLRLLRASFGFPPLDKDNFRYDPTLGGGVLIDAAAYMVKVSQFWLGGNLKVKAATLNYVNGVDIHGGAYLTGENGEISEVAFGMDNFYQCNYELWGSEGKITADRAYTAPPGFKPKIFRFFRTYSFFVCLC